MIFPFSNPASVSAKFLQFQIHFRDAPFFGGKNHPQNPMVEFPSASPSEVGKGWLASRENLPMSRPFFLFQQAATARKSHDFNSDTGRPVHIQDDQKKG